jgi:hypothetical protein
MTTLHLPSQPSFPSPSAGQKKFNSRPVLPTWINDGHKPPDLENAMPQCPPSGHDRCGCCLKALQNPSGEHSRTNKAEHVAQPKFVDKNHLLDHAVVFSDP